MDPIRETQKKYGKIALTVAIFISLGFILAGLKPHGKGLILGTLFSILNFIIMGQTIPLRLGHTRNKSILLSFFTIFGRYALLAAPLYLAIRYDTFNLITTVVGIFSVQIAILADHFLQMVILTRKKRAEE
jgi:hypothetical protein